MILRPGVILTATLALLAVAAALLLVVRMVEPRLAFFPLPGESTTPAAFGVPHDTLSVTTGDGEQLQGWRLGPAKAGPHVLPRAHVVYFHGNGGNLSIWAPVLAGLARRGYAVTAFDYRGYGNSTGRPSEHGLYRDVDAVIERFWSGPQPEAPVVWQVAEKPCNLN